MQAAAEGPALLARGRCGEDALVDAVDGFISSREAFEAAWRGLKEATALVVGAGAPALGQAA